MLIRYGHWLAPVAAVLLSTAPAAAKDCKNTAVTATSRDYVSRSFGAFPGSWAAWRKEVKDQIGDGWQAWRLAEERSIKCEQTTGPGRRWTCTRTARPCKPGPQSVSTSSDGKPATSPLAYVPINQVLRLGMRNEQVRTLQYLLTEAGYTMEIDGYFGRSTEEALKDFQRKNDLRDDGRAGPATVEALTS